MKTIKEINSKEIAKRVNNERYYSVESFAADCVRYAKAVKDGRLITTVKSVARSSMSRKIDFSELAKGYDGRYYLNNFLAFFRALGYRVPDYCIVVNGGGMDMIFATNYDVCRALRALGVLSEKECADLSRKSINLL